MDDDDVLDASALAFCASLEKTSSLLLVSSSILAFTSKCSRGILETPSIVSLSW